MSAPVGLNTLVQPYTNPNFFRDFTFLLVINDLISIKYLP